MEENALPPGLITKEQKRIITFAKKTLLLNFGIWERGLKRAWRSQG